MRAHPHFFIYKCGQTLSANPYPLKSILAKHVDLDTLIMMRDLFLSWNTAKPPPEFFESRANNRLIPLDKSVISDRGCPNRFLESIRQTEDLQSTLTSVIDNKLFVLARPDHLFPPIDAASVAKAKELDPHHGNCFLSNQEICVRPYNLIDRGTPSRTVLTFFFIPASRTLTHPISSWTRWN